MGCTHWVSPNNKYQVVSQPDGTCYIDAAGDGPSPPPPPPPSRQGISNQDNGFCLSTNPNPHNGDVVTVDDCDQHSAEWTFDDNQIKYDDLCLDATDMKSSNALILWECNGMDQQQWTFGSDNSFQLSNSMCLDSFSDSNGGGGLQLWECNSLNNQKWILSTA